MGVFPKLFGDSGSEVCLALDVGTEVVKALVFEMDVKDNRGVVTGVGRQRQKPGNMRSGAVSDIAGVIESSRAAIEIAKKQAKAKKIDKAILGIAGELVKGTTTTVHYERIRPEARIEFAELKEIIQQVQRKAYERIQGQLAYETNQETIDIKLINAAIVDVRIDGYKITNPMGFQGRDVSISVFNAYAPLIHLGALEKIADELGIATYSIAAEPYAVSRAIMSDVGVDFSAIFVDIGGGTTDVAVVRNGGLEGTKMYALGGRAFTKRIAQEFTLDLEDAERIKIEYSLGKLNTGIAETVHDLLQEDSKVWVSGMELALSEFAESDFLPSKILLCGGGSALDEIQRALADVEWTRSLPFSSPIQMSFLNPTDVKRMSDATHELTTPQDVTPLSLASLALEMMGEEKVLSGILRRTAKKINDER